MRRKVINFKLNLEDEKKGQRYIDRLNIPKNKNIFLWVKSREEKSKFELFTEDLTGV